MRRKTEGGGTVFIFLGGILGAAFLLDESRIVVNEIRTPTMELLRSVMEIGLPVFLFAAGMYLGARSVEGHRLEEADLSSANNAQAAQSGIPAGSP